ncbi:MAG TPA: rod shape-determining protein MreC [Candidatus Paceibacterota bacterium]|nr:rod shape-determining protein MreC [Candidatus Paceibacterota bacterium]
MRNTGLKFLARATAAVIALVILNSFLLHHLRAHENLALVSRASWYDLVGQLHETAGYIGQWNTIVTENELLRKQLQQQQVTKAQIASLKAQNDLLDSSLGLSNKLDEKTIPAGIYSLSLEPDGYTALLNKGSSQGVAVGDTVISATGVLVGQIESTFPNSSRIHLISDPSFTVTVKVSGSSTSGIARGALSAGMNLELITQDDTITEGNELVSTGDDQIPAGLVVGTVSNVSNDSTQIFKKVSVKPAADFDDGSVLVLHR